VQSINTHCCFCPYPRLRKIAFKLILQNSYTHVNHSQTGTSVLNDMSNKPSAADWSKPLVQYSSLWQPLTRNVRMPTTPSLPLTIAPKTPNHRKYYRTPPTSLYTDTPIPAHKTPHSQTTESSSIPIDAGIAPGHVPPGCSASN
jgi:hypothetical protein